MKKILSILFATSVILTTACTLAQTITTETDIERNTENTGKLYVSIVTSEGNYEQYNSSIIEEVDFGTVGLGAYSSTKSFIIGIPGDVQLKFTGKEPIVITGENADQFTIIQPIARKTAPGSYIQDASILFKPTSAGTKTAKVTIENNSENLPSYSFTIKGTAFAWPKSSSSIIEFGNDKVTKVITDSSDNIYLIGVAEPVIYTYIWKIQKFNKAGTELWNREFNRKFSDYFPTQFCPKYAIIDNLDNIVISNDECTIKISPDGELICRAEFGGLLAKGPDFIAVDDSLTKKDINTVDKYGQIYNEDETYSTNGLCFCSSESSPYYRLACYTLYGKYNENAELYWDLWMIDFYSRDSDSFYSKSGDSLSINHPNSETVVFNDNTIYCLDYTKSSNQVNFVIKKAIYTVNKEEKNVNIENKWEKQIDQVELNNKLGYGVEKLINTPSNFLIFYYVNGIKKLVIVDLEGNTLGTFTTSEILDYLETDQSGNFILCNKRSNQLLKIDTSCNIIKSINTGVNTEDVCVDSQGNIYVAGSGYNLVSTKSGMDWFVKKYSSDLEEF